MYSESPRVKNLEVFTIGATVPATHSVSIEEEFIGVSNGEPGQEFGLQNSPVLALRKGETLEVEEMRDGLEVYVPWKMVNGFSNFSQFRICTLTKDAINFPPTIVSSKQCIDNLNSISTVMIRTKTFAVSKFMILSGNAFFSSYLINWYLQAIILA